MKTCPWCNQIVESRMKRFIRFLIAMPVIVGIILIAYSLINHADNQNQCEIKIPGIKGKFCQIADASGTYYANDYYEVRVK